MSWWRDIFRQCVFMSFFIIPIPIGSYTIHSSVFSDPSGLCGHEGGGVWPETCPYQPYKLCHCLAGTGSYWRCIQRLYGADMEGVFILGMAYSWP